MTSPPLSGEGEGVIEGEGSGCWEVEELRERGGVGGRGGHCGDLPNSPQLQHEGGKTPMVQH